MLTDQEEMLLKNRDKQFLQTFYSSLASYHPADNPGRIRPDIPLHQLNQSESTLKFSISTCYESSIILRNHSCFPLNSCSENQSSQNANDKKDDDLTFDCNYLIDCCCQRLFRLINQK